MESAREKILARIKAAQDKRGEIEVQNPGFTSAVYHKLDDDLRVEFRKNLELIGGKVLLCATKAEAAEAIQTICREKNQEEIFCTDEKLQAIVGDGLTVQSDEAHFLDLNIGLTGCEFLVAHLGSVLISSAQVSGRRLYVFPETHVVVASRSQLTDYLEQAMEKMQEKYKNNLPSLISNITGPSRTADIEKTLVMGMHGPKSLFVIISDEEL